jgi:hypothetical protein
MPNTNSCDTTRGARIAAVFSSGKSMGRRKKNMETFAGDAMKMKSRIIKSTEVRSKRKSTMESGVKWRTKEGRT